MRKGLALLTALLLAACLFGCANEEPPDPNGIGEQVVYSNAEYGFTFTLPAGWAGYEIVVEQWEGTALGDSERDENGPQILIRHPQWTTDEPRQDIPIMVFTVNQWEALRQEEFSVGAAPIPPRELGRNSDYVFALPARYNFAFPTGYEEVEQILAGDALFVMSPQP